jgi:hypothetical protein
MPCQVRACRRGHSLDQHPTLDASGCCLSPCPGMKVPVRLSPGALRSGSWAGGHSVAAVGHPSWPPAAQPPAYPYQAVAQPTHAHGAWAWLGMAFNVQPIDSAVSGS